MLVLTPTPLPTLGETKGERGVPEVAPASRALAMQGEPVLTWGPAAHRLSLPYLADGSYCRGRLLLRGRAPLAERVAQTFRQTVVWPVALFSLLPQHTFA